jgi:ATP-dependent DNA helicase RecQ
MIDDDGRRRFNGSTIIYCSTKNATTDVLIALRSHGINCEQYHAGLSLEARKQAQVKFINDQTDVMVCTVAFGMVWIEFSIFLIFA